MIKSQIAYSLQKIMFYMLQRSHQHERLLLTYCGMSLIFNQKQSEPRIEFRLLNTFQTL